eukprot:4391505-Amphidinium_carterae.1
MEEPTIQQRHTDEAGVQLTAQPEPLCGTDEQHTKALGQFVSQPVAGEVHFLYVGDMVWVA